MLGLVYQSALRNNGRAKAVGIVDTVLQFCHIPATEIPHQILLLIVLSLMHQW